LRQVGREAFAAAAVESLAGVEPEYAVLPVDAAVLGQLAEPEVEQSVDGLAIHAPHVLRPARLKTTQVLDRRRCRRFATSNHHWGLASSMPFPPPWRGWGSASTDRASSPSGGGRAGRGGPVASMPRSPR